ncbi:MAG TPA: hypothetical protein VFS49_03975 [Croceibacterium sp.]|nr:hypothetical protein [Croceibacterium sp.]
MNRRRRAMLRLAGLAVTLPLATILAGPARAAEFAAPTGPMLYTRRLERELADGTWLVVSRSFAVRFLPEGDGFRVVGEQVGVEVDAPEQLATLAQLERERVETALFPLQLDSTGAIRSVPRAAPSEQLDQAVREVTARIAQLNRPAADREALQAFVETVHRSAGELVTELPRDLFAPADVPREESRTLTLPGGEIGRVRVTFSAQRAADGGLMRTARREVVTEVSGDVRHTIESWTLAPLTG